MDKIVAFLLRLNKEQLLLGAISLFSATQLSRHLWPTTAFVYGVRVDYLSAALYFLDILITLFLIMRAKRIKNFSLSTFNLINVLPVLLTNLLFSGSPLATLVWSLRFLLYSVFAAALSNLELLTIVRVLPLAMALQIVIGAAQTMQGHSIQGLLYWLGERALDVGSPNVAKWSWDGQMMLRSYGTFSHPNVLAGWLVVAFLIVTMCVKTYKQALTQRMYYQFLPMICVILGLFLTQSRAAALSFVGIALPVSLLRTKMSWLKRGLVVGAGLYGAVILSLLFTRSNVSVTDRLRLMYTSGQIIAASPLFGSGANASISLYPTVAPSLRLLQPDHNSITLLLSWLGIVGGVALIYSLRSRFQFFSSHFKYFLPLLPLVLLDHYFLTSVQGLFIILLYLRFLATDLQ